MVLTASSNALMACGIITQRNRTHHKLTAAPQHPAKSTVVQSVSGTADKRGSQPDAHTFWVFWTSSGPTSLQDIRTASGGGPLGQLSLALHAHSSYTCLKPHCADVSARQHDAQAGLQARYSISPYPALQPPPPLQPPAMSCSHLISPQHKLIRLVPHTGVVNTLALARSGQGAAGTTQHTMQL